MTVGAAAGVRDGRKKGVPGSAVAQVPLNSIPEMPRRLVMASAVTCGCRSSGHREVHLGWAKRGRGRHGELFIWVNESHLKNQPSFWNYALLALGVKISFVS